MDVVTLWKVVSLILTGSFGILGLLKEFKSKETGRITGWGLISLVGILASTTLGTFAQFREWAHQQESRANTAEKTLQLLQNTDQAVRDIGRLLSPLEEPRIDVIFISPCKDQFQRFCDKLASDSNVQSVQQFQHFPGGIPRFFVAVDFFRNNEDAENYMKESHENKSDLSIWVKAAADVEDSLRFIKAPFVDELWVTLGQKVTTSSGGNNRIRSTKDLSGSTMLLTASWSTSNGDPPAFNNVTLKYFALFVSSGEPIVIDMKQFRQRTGLRDIYGRPFTIFQYTFPKTG